MLFNGALVVIWALTGASFFWPAIPMLIWGIGLVFHAWDIYQQPFNEQQIQRGDEANAVTGPRGGWSPVASVPAGGHPDGRSWPLGWAMARIITPADPKVLPDTGLMALLHRPPVRAGLRAGEVRPTSEAG